MYAPAQIRAAEELWKEGNHDAAWMALEKLAPIDRVMPEVIDLQLRILTCLCKWDLGDDLASALRFASDEEDEVDSTQYRITCAEYFHARARSLCAEGDITGAKERVGWAAELFPPIRLEMVHDPALRGVW